MCSFTNRDTCLYIPSVSHLTCAAGRSVHAVKKFGYILPESLQVALLKNYTNNKSTIGIRNHKAQKE